MSELLTGRVGSGTSGISSGSFQGCYFHLRGGPRMKNKVDSIALTKRLILLAVMVTGCVFYVFSSQTLSNGLSRISYIGRDNREVSLQGSRNGPAPFDSEISNHAQQMVEEGRNIFRFDTFGDEEFWGDTLKIHQ